VSYDLKIEGATLVDGSGGPPRRAAIGIRDGRFVAVGDAPESGARTIDANGLVAAPGFIDVHTHYDAQLLWDPLATSSCWHGVTTVVTGNCGFSLAPCREADRDRLMRMLVVVEGMSLEALRRGIVWEWETVPEYYGALVRRGLGVNVAPLVGHSAVRSFVMGEGGWERAATSNEIARMKEIVRGALRAGAFGFATSQATTHFGDDNRPVPSRLAADEEIFALGTVLSEEGRGVIEIAPRSVLGSDTEKREDVELFVRLAAATGRPVSFAPLFAEYHQPGLALEMIERTVAAAAQGARVYPQVGCRPLLLRFPLADGPLLKPFDAWQEIADVPATGRARRLRDPALRQRFLTEAKDGNIADANSHRLFLETARAESHRSFEGRSLAEIAAERGSSAFETVLDLAAEDGLEDEYGLVVANGDEETVARLLSHPRGLIALSDAGAHVNMICDAGYTSTLLEKWVRRLGAMPLEEAVRRLTSMPAEIYGMHDRGRIAPGYAADVVLFDADRVRARNPEFVHDLPGGEARLIQRAEGIQFVIVNGRVLLEGDRPSGDLPGTVLRPS